ncbi:MAG: hypothetical protein PHY34_06425 [Patescibacteria group bacterium]|nr:hypothetical protein [Patescibacteria group bacterium]
MAYEKRFRKMADNAGGVGDYDILACYSGGKDSTYMLKLLKDRYGLRVLAFTFDNGFFPDGAMRNIRNVIGVLGIDHIMFRPEKRLINKIFREALKKDLYPPRSMERASAVCLSCIGLVKYISFKTAIQKHIPMVAFGWSPGQAPVASSILELDKKMVRKMEDAIRRPLATICGKDINRYFISTYEYKSCDKFPIIIHPLGFTGYNERKILREIAKMGWKRPAGTEPNATNCLLSVLADHEHIKRHGYHPYVFDISRAVRDGYMTRKEGLAHLKMKKNRKTLAYVRKRLLYGQK